jgi:hypothetical protein
VEKPRGDAARRPAGRVCPTTGTLASNLSSRPDGTHPFGARCGTGRREPGNFSPLSRGRSQMDASILISILITFLVIVLVLYLVNMLPVDSRVQQIIRLIVIVIGIVSMLKYLAVF